MLGLYVWMMDTLTHFREEQSGQDTFEYLLVIGGISVAVVFAMLTPIGKNLITSVINGTCTAVATVLKTASC